MKTLIFSLVAAIAAASLHAAEPKELRIATQPSPLYSPIFVAKQKGWVEEEFKKDGFTVKWSSFVAGPPENESFLAGQQDIGFIGDTPLIVGRSVGLNTRVIGIASTAPSALALAVPKGSAIHAVADLKEKKVGVTKGSYAHHLLFLLLKNAGLKSTDIKLIHLPPGDLVTAFSRGDLDAAVTWEPYLGELENLGGKVIADGSGGVKEGAVVIFAVDDFGKKNPEVLQRFLKIYQKGVEFIKANPEETAKLVAPEAKIPAEQVLKLLPKFDFSPLIKPGHIAELKKTETFLRENNLTSGPVDIDAFFDTSYQKAAGLQ
ncbi:MAG: aliphatic sulfonate ABC transporter substrate-binding protein [Chthoniobacteraceae bacterium]